MAITARRWLIAGGVATLALLMAYPAQAAFPGANGKLAVMGVYPNDDIHTLNPDGTGITALAPAPGPDSNPAWSPDGKRIAFDSSRAGSSEIFVMDADGSNLTMLTTSPYPDMDPYWSPDGTRIVFESARAGNNWDLWVMDADGSNPTRLTTDPAEDRDPSWSPDGTKIAFSSDRESFVCDDPENPWCFVRPTFRIFTVGVAGGPATMIVSTFPPDNCSPGEDAYQPDWSPSGDRVAHERIWESWCDEGFYHAITATGAVRPFLYEIRESSVAFGTAWSPDGSEVAFVNIFGNLQAASADGAVRRTIVRSPPTLRYPNWLPIPVNAYPRPKGASPMDASFVPAYEPCTAPNRTHGPPLAFGSCSPPARAPGQLTVGTPDTNGQGAKSVGSLRMNPRPGDPTTPADEADVVLRSNITDVRLRSDLSDYTGSLEVRMSIQITDKDNTPHPGGPGPATVQELTQSYPLPCNATADSTVGSTCGFDTTIEAFVPGAVKELRRAIWHLGTIRVHDGAGNLFLTQGIWVP